jgi:hypothetical protein
MGTTADQPDLILRGQNLDGAALRVLFQHPRLVQPLEPIVGERSPTAIHLRLPAPGDPADPAAPSNQWLAGLYRVKAVISDPASDQRSTNELAIALAPKILTESLDIRRAPPSNGDPFGKVTITLRCLPTVTRSQSVSLLLGDREIAWLLPLLPDPPPANPDVLRYSELQFEARRLPPGAYWMRLRVDGIDSPLIINRADQPSFDPTQRVTLP